MKSILIRTLCVLLVGVILLFGLPQSTPAAAQPVKVELTNTDGTAATSWAINNLVPGNSGHKDVVLTNSGTGPGSVEIWISKISGTEGTPARFGLAPTPGGDLQNNLSLNLTASGLNADFLMPAIVNDFPQGASSPRHLSIPSLGAGSSMTLTWDWNLPYATGNEAQGDGVSFDVNYSLTEITSGGGGGGGGGTISTPAPPVANPTPATHTRIIGLAVPNTNTISEITDQGIVTGGLAVTTPDTTFSLSIEQGTRVLISNENRPNPVDLSKIGDTVPTLIEVTNPPLNEIPTLPDGWIPVSQAYDINAVTNNYVTGIQMDRPATLVIKCNQNELPEIVDGMAIFYYNYQDGWTQLDPPPGYIAQGNEFAGQVDHFSLFIVLARARSSPKLPANILIQKLTVDPPRILVGQSSDVRVKVTNTGGLPSEYIVVVRVAGKIQKTQSVRLAAGQSTEINFILTPGVSGIYTVTAGPASDNLTVDPLIIPDVLETNYWWLLCISLGFSTLVFTLFRRRYTLN